MSVVPHRSEKTGTPPVAPSGQRAKTIASSALKIAERIAKLADDTASQTKSATQTAVSAGKTGLQRAVEIGRESLLPEIERTGATLKERTRPDRLKHDYREYLLMLHERVLDPPIESLFFNPTKDPVALSRPHHSRQQPRIRPRLSSYAMRVVRVDSRRAQPRSVASHLRRSRRGQGTRAAARLAASVRGDRRHRVRRGAA